MAQANSIRYKDRVNDTSIKKLAQVVKLTLMAQFRCRSHLAGYAAKQCLLSWGPQGLSFLKLTAAINIPSLRDSRGFLKSSRFPCKFRHSSKQRLLFWCLRRLFFLKLTLMVRLENRTYRSGDIDGISASKSEIAAVSPLRIQSGIPIP